MSGTETDQAPSVSAVKAALLVAGVWAKEKITLTSTHIANQYVDLAYLAKDSSVVGAVMRLAIHEGDDYTLSTVSGKTRLTFAGEIATGGNSALVAGDILHLTYAKG